MGYKIKFRRLNVSNRKIKKIRINGMEARIVLPKTIKFEDIPKRINTTEKKITGLLVSL